MNIKEKLEQKTIGYYIAFAAAVVALIGLIIYFAYVGQGGIANAAVIICVLIGIGVEVLLFFYDKKFGDLIAITPAILFSVGFVVSLADGVGNIADAVEDIVMYGIKELAPLNYTIAVFFFIATVAAIVACFIKREKE